MRIRHIPAASEIPARLSPLVTSRDVATILDQLEAHPAGRERLDPGVRPTYLERRQAHQRSFDAGPRVVIITGPGFQDHDTIYCGYRFREAHFRVDFATIDGAPPASREGMSTPHGELIVPSVSFDDLDVDAYDLVVLPGGYEAPDRMRQDQRVKDFVVTMAQSGGRRAPHDPRVRDFVVAMMQAGKPVVGLCRGPWIMDAAIPRLPAHGGLPGPARRHGPRRRNPGRQRGRRDAREDHHALLLRRGGVVRGAVA